MSWGLVGVLGGIAALLQVAGYSLYIRNFLNKSIRPNAASFLMFSYGTSLLAFLEWRNGATWALLALPVTCAVIGIVVAAMCLRKGATEPIDRFEAFAFSTDLWLTILYAWFALGLGDASGVAAPFLIATNLTAVTCFVPIVRSTWRAPYRELPGPWIVWTAAYGLLGLTTWLADRGANPALMVYPALNFALHGLVALLALRRADGRIWLSLGRRLYLGRSTIDGIGVFAARAFRQGEPICTLRGKLHRDPTKTDPNWIGIGPGAWIEADHPLDRVNHSCAANAAFTRKRRLRALRPIAAGEEVTIDYSTTEVDPAWTMACDCRAENCRKGLHAIQVSFADRQVAPPASPLMRLIWWQRKVTPVDNPAFPQIAAPAPRVPARRTGKQPALRKRSRVSAG